MEKKATFGAGCFWGVEAAFRRLDGVTGTRVGYAGGGVDNPTLRAGLLGHDGPRRGRRGHLRRRARSRTSSCSRSSGPSTTRRS